MVVYAITINRKMCGDEEMVYLWRKKKDAREYVSYINAGIIVPMELRRLKSDDPWKK